MKHSYFLTRETTQTKKELKTIHCTFSPKQNIIYKDYSETYWLCNSQYRHIISKKKPRKIKTCAKWAIILSGIQIVVRTWHVIHQLNTPMQGGLVPTSLSQTGYNKSETTLTWGNEIADCMLTLDNRGNYQMTQICYLDQPLHLPNPPLVVATDQKIYYLRSYVRPLFYIN